MISEERETQQGINEEQKIVTAPKNPSETRRVQEEKREGTHDPKEERRERTQAHQTHQQLNYAQEQESQQRSSKQCVCEAVQKIRENKLERWYL